MKIGVATHHICCYNVAAVQSSQIKREDIVMAGKLYIVGTPIGNLGDLSPRAVETLRAADFIAAEDTRVTVKLLNHFEISTPMTSYHEHNLRERGEYIMERIENGESCALVTDAGMPAISDPGEDLVRLAHSHGIRVETVPGPTAMATALALSGMNVGRFCFEGFLTTVKSNRFKRLESLKAEERTLVFYEAPHKLMNTLKDMLSFFGDREIALCKELTKLHESVFKTTLSGAIAHYSEVPPKGEFVLVVSGAEKQTVTFSLEEAVARAQNLLNSGMPATMAAKTAAKETGIKKGDIYKVLTAE